MFRKRKSQNSLAVSIGLIIMLFGSSLVAMKMTGFVKTPTLEIDNSKNNSEVMQLAQSTSEERLSKLETIAQGSKSIDRSRARYLLAAELIEQKQEEKALKWLEGLEQEYSLLASHAALQKARAYESMGNKDKARSAWEELLYNYPKDIVAPHAMLALLEKDAKYGDEAMAKFPSHPKTIEIARRRLQQNPNQLPLMLLFAKHGIYRSDYATVVDQLVKKYADKLKQEDWEIIAFGYWEKQLYGKAGRAYLKANHTPLNIYRAARGLQLDGKGYQAKPIYRDLIKEFPDAKETPIALLRLAGLAEPKDASFYLNKVIEAFPDKAPEALLEKADILEKLDNNKLAAETRELLLTKYSKSDAAAQLRWRMAKKRANVNDFQAAWQWAQPITTENPDSELAAEAGFWVGKWANKLGRQQEAKAAFEQVFNKYPQTYYAWRSAVLLGKNVGDFTTVRNLSPELIRSARPNLLVGSDTLKELYYLGQNQDAWNLWQMEFKNQMEPSVEEQFTDGLLRISINDNIEGMFMISSLDKRDKPEERSQYLKMKQTKDYWQALYPFPYLDIINKWSKERRLNSILVAALIRQESRFMPEIKSKVGATGLMQVMPETASWVAERISLKKYQLNNPNDNINLGTWYLDYTHQEYKNNSMLAVASYNAGPGKVSEWLQKYNLKDPDDFVEAIPFPETKGYVKSVFENYWNYLRLYTNNDNQMAAAHSN